VTTHNRCFDDRSTHKRQALLYAVERHTRDDMAHLDFRLICLQDCDVVSLSYYKCKDLNWEAARTYVIGVPVMHQVARYWTEELREHLTIHSGGRVQQVQKSIGQRVRHTRILLYIRLVLICHRRRTHERGGMFVA